MTNGEICTRVIHVWSEDSESCQCRKRHRACRIGGRCYYLYNEDGEHEEHWLPARAGDA